MRDILDWIKQIGTHRILWASDLDWTIADNIHADPRGCPVPEAAAACRAADAATRGKFYIITGRDIESTDRILPGVQAKISSEYHNRVRLDPGAPPVDLGPRPQWHLIDPDLDALTARFSGALLRKKPFMRTLNFSKADGLKDPATRAAVRQELHGLLGRVTAATGLALGNIDGGSVFDMGPAGRDKGLAFSDIFNHAAQGYKGAGPLVPLYFGDSPGDLPAARFAQQNGGRFVSVGPDARVASVADFRLATTAECRAVMAAALALTGPKGP